MKSLWDAWEIKAIEYLKSKGYHIITTNYKYGRIWEIDIIASKDFLTVFFEVKLRSDSSYWNPLESITFLKRKKIYKTILAYMGKYQLSEENIRFDIITIQWNDLEHFEACELIQ